MIPLPIDPASVAALCEPGQCYKSAFDVQVRLREWTLVHGIVTGQGPIAGLEYGHAWLEITDASGIEWVFDPTRKDVYPKAFYYLAGNISFTQRYSVAEAFAMADETMNYGPWDSYIQKAAHITCKEEE